MAGYPAHLTQAFVHLGRLTHNLRVLQSQVGKLPLWPCVKGRAYGHDLKIVASHLTTLGYDTLTVADVGEGIILVEAGIQATVVVLSETLPEHSEALVCYGFQPTISTLSMAESLSKQAQKAGRTVSVHLKVDTGMGRVGMRPEDVSDFIQRCLGLPGLKIRGIMSHFPKADEADKRFSLHQIRRFQEIVDVTKEHGVEVFHMANSAAILDLPGSYFDACRPGIAIYGLSPSSEIVSERVKELQPVLEWKTRVTFLKEVPSGTGLSYKHTYHTTRPSLIATVPVGYADGLSRSLSNRIDLLVGGVRCPQVGLITMDMALVDVTRLRSRVNLGDEVVIIGGQGAEEISADELAEKLGEVDPILRTKIGRC